MIGLPGAKAVMFCIWWSFAHAGSPNINVFQYDSFAECEAVQVNMIAPTGAVDFKALCLPGPLTRT